MSEYFKTGVKILIIHLISAYCLVGLANDPLQITVLVLGDSLSAEYGIQRGMGWVALLEKQLNTTTSKTYKFVNASISGETTAGGLQRIIPLIEQNKPSLTIIELGANDALRGLSLEMTQNNLRQIIKTAQKTGAILLFEIKIPTNYGKKYTEEFQQMFLTLARENKSTLVPFFLSDIATQVKYFQQDRIHPNEDAQPIILKKVLPYVKKNLAQ